MEQDKIDGLSPRYNPEPFVVVEKDSMVTVQNGEKTLCRNTAKCKPLKYEGNKDSEDEWQPSSKRQVQNNSKETTDAERRTTNQELRPTRNRMSNKDTKYRVAQKKVYAFDFVQRKNYKCYVPQINVILSRKA